MQCFAILFKILFLACVIPYGWKFEKKYSDKIAQFLRSPYICWPKNGGIAQLARALAWHARGHGFESHYLHKKITQVSANQVLGFFILKMGQVLGQDFSLSNTGLKKMNPGGTASDLQLSLPEFVFWNVLLIFRRHTPSSWFSDHLNH